MIISSHLCLLTDGSFGRFPMARLGKGGVVESLDLCPDGPEEVGGMVFRGGIMVCGLPADFRSEVFEGKNDFSARMRQYAVRPGGGTVSVLCGGDLTTLRGAFSRWQPDFIVM